MKKISKIGYEARDLFLKGGFYVADAVMSTMGVFGTNGSLQKGNKITNDGFLISKELIDAISNEFERQGARVALEASSKTNDEVADGTSSAWALWKHIIKEAIRYLPNDKSIKAKKTSSEIKEWIEQSKQEVLRNLKSQVAFITSKEELIKSALVSVENEKIAELLGSMQWELGPDGQIIAEEVNDIECSIEKVKGIRLDNGFGASILVTNPEKQSLEVNNLPILLTNYVLDVIELDKLKLSIFQSLVAQKKHGIIIVARAWTENAIKLCQQSAQSGFSIFPINAPYVNQTQIMKDIESVVGGRYIDTVESSLEDIYITDIGFCERLEAKINSAIVTGKEDKQADERIQKRVAILKKTLEGEKSDFYKKMLQERIAQLLSGFAILKVGAISVAERQRLKDKCDDAVNAVRHAFKGGTVKGGGLAFKEISEELGEDNILKRPITCIYDQIMTLAPEGYIIPEWVRDPYLVLESALRNACDIAGTMASITSAVVDKNPKECKCNHEE